MSKFDVCTHCNSKIPTVELKKDIENNYICIGCTEQVIAVAPTIKFFEPSGVHDFMWTKEFGFQDRKTRNSVPNIPAIESYDSNGNMILYDGFEIVISKWEYDFLREDQDAFVEFVKALTKRLIIPPMPLVFNMIQAGGLKMLIDVIVRNKDVDTFKQWVDNSHNLRLN